MTIMSLLAGGYVAASATQRGTVHLSVNPTGIGSAHSKTVALGMSPQEALDLADQLHDAVAALVEQRQEASS